MSEQLLREINQDNLSKAIKKARRVKPLVRRTDGASIFKVRSSDGETFYRVRVGKSGNKFIADCTCQGFKQGELCYHIPSACYLSEACMNALSNVASIQDYKERKAA